MKYKSLISLLLFVLLSPHAHAGEDAQRFALGKNFAKTHQMEFAYMQFRDIVIHNVGSPFREASLFATGEYFADISNFPEAITIFTQFLKEYPDSKAKIFVLGYLYKIAQETNDTEQLEKLKTDIVTLQQVSFVFRNSKDYQYRSPTHKQYRAVVRINQITIYNGSEILAEISY
ncbi:MAG: hypothetical protein A3D10_01570 [Omnitrophica WOR_2 bacterium RIFCSPHIGHO2_02_FULL_48_11]|nr:MAG: hypothetical protein A3D10_01570 [Omnitrophica WOR_2 bacterium RIFCSPHIGHO2_02_FULL_48_11]